MTEYVLTIQLYQTSEYICKQGFLIFQILEDTWPAVIELEEGLFVYFRKRN